jgi:hypothetical protein
MPTHLAQIFNSRTALFDLPRQTPQALANWICCISSTHLMRVLPITYEKPF